MTPNYEDANHTDFSISPWCSCKNSGNQEEECEKFLRDFRENTCLRKNHIENRTALLLNHSRTRTIVLLFDQFGVTLHHRPRLLYRTV